MTTPTRAELLERIKANARFVEAKPGASVVIVRRLLSHQVPTRAAR